MNKFLLIPFIILIISCGSNNSNPNNSNVIAIDVNNDLEILYGKDIVEDIKYIPLKIVDNKFLIESINSVLVTDSLLFIADRSQKALFVYDSDGNPLHKIGSMGQGPGEYISLSEVILDREKRKIIICDLSSRKILHYDFSGKLLKETGMPYEDLNYFAMDSKSDIIISERCDLKRDLLIAFDESKDIINSHLKLNKKHVNHYIPLTSIRWESSPFYTYNDTVFYLSIFDYAIYSYTDGKFNREYYLNIPENLKITSTVPVADVNEYYAKQLLYKFTSLTVTDDLITFKAWGLFGSNNVLYDRKNKKSYCYQNLYCEGEGFYQDQLLTEYNGWFVFLIYDQKGLEYLQKDVGIALEEDANPVLCFVKFKKSL
jgi:hypothetical protein